MKKYLPTFVKLFISFILSLLPSLYLGGQKGFDICNEGGTPFISTRTVLCPSDIYDWTGIRIWALIVNIIIWTVVIFKVILIATILINKKKLVIKK
jgi:hypothetical protein